MGLDLEGIQQRKEEEQTSGGGAEWVGQDRSSLWKPSEGNNSIVLLPHTSAYFHRDVSDIAIRYNSHFLSPEGFKNLVTLCPLNFEDEDFCPVCRMSDRYRDSDNEQMRELAWDAFRSKRRLMNILDLDDPGAGIQRYESGKKVYSKFLGYVGKPSWMPFIDPSEANPIDLVRQEGKNYRDVSYRVEPEPTKKDFTGVLPEDLETRLDELEDYKPERIDDETLNEYLEALGFPVNNTSVSSGETVSEPSDSETESVDSSSPSEVGEPVGEPVGETVSEPDEVGTPVESPEEGGDSGKAGTGTEQSPASADSGLSEDPSEKAVAYAESHGTEIVEPPAASEEETPVCFGGFDPDTRPCDSCAVEGTCIEANLGVLED